MPALPTLTPASSRFAGLKGTLGALVWLFVLACGNAHLPRDATAIPTDVPDGPDPTSFTPARTRVNLVSMQRRNGCLAPKTGAAAVAGDPIGTIDCTGSEDDRWQFNPDGSLGFGSHLCLSAASAPAQVGQGLVLAPCSGNDAQAITLQGGRLMFAAGQSGATGIAIGIGRATAQSTGFSPGLLEDGKTLGTQPSQQWRVGLAGVGLAGDGNVVLTGFPISLAQTATMCLTGRGNTVGVTTCNGSASQAWIINEVGGVQLGAYCLDASTPGTISQGTPGLFNLCRTGTDAQSWRVDYRGIWLQNLYLSPTVVPPPKAGYTASALVTSEVGWQLGG